MSHSAPRNTLSRASTSVSGVSDVTEIALGFKEQLKFGCGGKLLQIEQPTKILFSTSAYYP